MDHLVFKLTRKNVINGDGSFNDEGIDRFVKEIKLAECGLSYAVVSIMGPQSSVASKTTNGILVRSQTTKGIWIAKCAGLEPCTLVMDLEGTDGRERGEDDTAFEKQSALFALAVSDIVLINMWCHDIGREQAANKPLLKTVFQVMMRLFSPRKTTLMFVIRDKTRTPLEHLEPVLREDIQKIWDSVPKPEAHMETSLSEFFNVEVVALSSYEGKEELFKEQVANLRQRFFHSIAPGGIAGDRRGAVPASGFSFSAQHIWKVIKENKDLDLPAHKVMVATVRCEEIASEKYTSFTSNENWHSLEEAVKSGPVAGFGKKLNSILYTSLSEYDAEATYFDEGVRSAKRKHLEEKLLQLVQPAYQSMLGHLRIETLENFKEAFDKALKGDEGFSVAARQCIETYMASFDAGYADAAVELANWDSSKIRDKLRHDINDHVASVRAAKLSELTSSYEAKLNEALSGPVEALLDGANKETWPLIRKLLQRETESILSGLSTVLSGFDMDEQTQKKTLTSLANHARGVVEGKAKEEAGRVLIRMKDRFSTLFNHDSDSMPRVWTGKEDVRSISKTAHSAALKLLSVMAAIRLDDNVDNIENTLCSALLDTKGIASVAKWGSTTSDPLASSTWDKVPPNKILITPVQCKILWRQYRAETEYCEANKRSNNWLPPPWAIVALIILGFNEFLTLLRNPLYVGIIFIGYLMLKALWVQLDISGEFSHGVLPGIISLSTKFIPTIMSLLKKLAEEGQAAANNNPQSTNASASKSLPNTTSPSLTASSTVTSSANGTKEE
ncbi:hypothetical protein GOBAR_AA27912 [Gossypium barbadense]|uniref:Protein ROOT HAIR DEFECTIVE 3 homolog n=1 Tax=Gossypium barbadense TaxID=3634 RepID=A0A2P5WNT2_GOSBA|nr:hypothetical protein GOBAR_AA27912 [Gossypium barbadense]